MASRGILLVVYIFMLFLMNNSTFLKLSRSNTLLNLDTYGFEQFKRDSAVECNILSVNILDEWRFEKWYRRACLHLEIEKRDGVNTHQQERNEIWISYLSIIIILLSGDVSLNPDPQLTQEFPADNMKDIDDLLRCRGVSLVHTCQYSLAYALAASKHQLWQYAARD